MKLKIKVGHCDGALLLTYFLDSLIWLKKPPKCKLTDMMIKLFNGNEQNCVMMINTNTFHVRSHSTMPAMHS